MEFTTYQSPSDSVDVQIPDIPTEEDGSEMDYALNDDDVTQGRRKRKVSPSMADAMRRRRVALQKRRIEVEEAWMGWKKPLLKPGDVVALLQPCSVRLSDQELQSIPAYGSSARLVLVQRFWTENEERSRHVFWVPQCATIRGHADRRDPLRWCLPLGVNDSCFLRDVRHIELVSTSDASYKRGYDRFQPISSHGRLESGENYFIYRFLLFWDGFEISNGKSASGEGFYMLCLNLPLRARSSPNAVRIISLTPPGVKGDVVFKNIQQDIVKGMTTGFLDYDAQGKPIRIFLDLVGFIGDTPAINAALDVLGHTGGACCHLCRFVRRSYTIVGSRYTHCTSHGLSSYTRRGFFQHRAVRDSNARTETCRLLGMSSSDLNKPLPLHDLRLAMLSSQPLIPKTAEGIQLLTGYLDPYLSCLISPDHLLTGNFRDCVNTAFRLLPTNEHRKSVDLFAIGFLAECNLPTQNRLFDIKKKSLFSMSMTDLYALSVVAHHSFVRGCKAASSSRHTLSETCLSAINIVQSCSNVISILWDTDSMPRTKSAWGSSLTFLQGRTREHILRVQNLCKMTDEDVLSLGNAGKSRVRKAEIARKRRECLIAIKTIDKPNMHRLLELVHSTLPMIGHISRVGELVMEKAHQTLKRAIRRSNNKNVQIQSLLSAKFTDWQARLSIQVLSAMQGNENAIRGCVRLLSGRETIQNLKGQITEKHKEAVLRVLGPDCCVPALLDSQAKSVLSPRASCDGPVIWRLEGKREVASHSSTISTQERTVTYTMFSKMCRPVCNDRPLVFGNTLRSVYPNGMEGIAVSHGDVLDVSCHNFQDLSAQYPIAAQPHWAAPSPTVSNTIGSLFCCIVALFSRVNSGGLDEFWAAVYPCQVSRNYSSSTGTSCSIQDSTIRYQLYRKLTFVEMTGAVRKAARILLCEDNTCVPSSSRSRIIHGANCNPFEGTKFLILSRCEGYPPRQG